MSVQDAVATFAWGCLVSDEPNDLPMDQMIADFNQSKAPRQIAWIEHSAAHSAAFEVSSLC